eukprot:1194676-Prorocentrum_minimum.AAC.2
MHAAGPLNTPPAGLETPLNTPPSSVLVNVQTTAGFARAIPIGIQPNLSPVGTAPVPAVRRSPAHGPVIFAIFIPLMSSADGQCRSRQTHRVRQKTPLAAAGAV